MAIVFVVAAICSNAIYGPLLSSFSAVPSVQQYCTSKYPVAAVTATFTATPVTTAVTSIELFPALTVTETVGSIETMIASPTTVTNFALVVTEMTTATTTEQQISTKTEYYCPASPNAIKVRRTLPDPKSPCPNGTNSTYKTKSGDTYALCENSDSVGGDVQILSGVASASSCADACSQRTGCVAAVYKKGLKKCWMKGRIGTVTKCNDATVIYKMPSSTPATTSRKSTTSSSRSSSTSTSSKSSTTSSESSTTSSKSSTTSPSIITTSSRSITTTSTTTTSTQPPFQSDATFCSCVQTTPTSTISITLTTTVTVISSSTASPAITSTVTSVSETFTTPTSTTTLTPTTTLTISTFTSTVVQTATISSTTRVFPTSGSGPRTDPKDSCNCGYNVICGARFPPSIDSFFFEGVLDLEACQENCDKLSNCITAVFARRPSDGTKICSLYDVAGFNTATGDGLEADDSATLLTRTGSCTNLGQRCCGTDILALTYAGCFDGAQA